MNREISIVAFVCFLVCIACVKSTKPPKYYQEIIVLRSALEEFEAINKRLPESLSQLDTKAISVELRDELSAGTWEYDPEKTGRDFIVISPKPSDGRRVGLKRNYGIQILYD